MMLVALRKAHAALETGLTLASSGILFLLMLYVTAEVAMRYLFGSPLRGHLETTQLLIAPAALLALAWLQARRGHVGMDLVVERLSHRARAAADCIALTLALATFAVIAWFSADATWLAWDIGDSTPTAQLPTWWSKAAVPLGFGLLCLRLALQLVASLGVLFGRRPA
ncbi:MAG: TRAP transporter small permease [Rubrivivax sp.]|nr:TRAP transporter small permease [Rubrivivax sp.]